MRYPGLLLDLQGVLYEDGRALAGALDAVEWLRASGREVRCLTNTTTQPRRAIAARLRGLGFGVRTQEVFSPAVAAVGALGAVGARRIHLAAAPALAEDFTAFALADDEDADLDAVVLGDLYREFSWDRLDGLYRRIAGGTPLIALHKNRVTTRDGAIALDLGPFVAALEYAAGTEAQVVGKPSPRFFALALESLGLAPAQVLMVGDDIEADVGGALGAGLAAVQVRTGKYRPQDEAAGSVQPTARIDGIADLPAWLQRAD